MADTLRVSHMMNGVILHADKNENLEYIARLLLDNNANAIIIRDEGVPTGIVTSKDILRGLLHGDMRNIKGEHIMTTPFVSVDHDEDLLAARNLMLQKGLKKLPVRKDNDIIGLLVSDDIIRDIIWVQRLRDLE